VKKKECELLIFTFLNDYISEKIIASLMDNTLEELDLSKNQKLPETPQLKV